ncbi:NAD(P)-dependent dehydrogenase (short-subunit alcohol dehydrogenase family) [Rhizobium leguminosarum]
MGRQSEPLETAMPVVLLASDEASFVTGVALPVDGSYLAV